MEDFPRRMSALLSAQIWAILRTATSVPANCDCDSVALVHGAGRRLLSGQVRGALAQRMGARAEGESDCQSGGTERTAWLDRTGSTFEVRSFSERERLALGGVERREKEMRAFNHLQGTLHPCTCRWDRGSRDHAPTQGPNVLLRSITCWPHPLPANIYIYKL